MLSNAQTFTSYSVKSTEEAKSFYTEKLGLTPMAQPGPLRFEVGGSQFMMYEKPNHVAADFTIMNFRVEDIVGTIKDLKSKGVEFESYDNEHMKTDENNIYHSDYGQIAWFKDPSGNILSLVNM